MSSAAEYVCAVSMMNFSFSFFLFFVLPKNHAIFWVRVSSRSSVEFSRTKSNNPVNETVAAVSHRPYIPHYSFEFFNLSKSERERERERKKEGERERERARVQSMSSSSSEFTGCDATDLEAFAECMNAQVLSLGGTVSVQGWSADTFWLL